MGFVGFLGLLVAGAVIGVVARLLLPGRQPIGMLLTVVLGIAGALAGGALGDVILDNWVVNFILGVAVAALLIAVVAGAQARGSSGRRR